VTTDSTSTTWGSAGRHGGRPYSGSGPSPAEKVIVSRAGTPIVYRVFGDRGPFLVGCNGVGVSTVFFEPLARRLADSYRTILWDYPGHGRSGDPEDPRVDIEMLAADLAAVMDDAGAKQAVLIGHSLGTQVSLEFYRRSPERVLGLVPTHGTSGRTVSSFFTLPGLGVPVTLLVRRLLASGYRAWPALIEPLAIGPIRGRAALDHAARVSGLIRRDAPDLTEYFGHLVRVDLRVFASLIDSAQRHDATGLLPDIAVPTLVVGGTRDFFVPIGVVRRFARAVPGAELMELESATHAGLFEQLGIYEARLRDFLCRRVFSPAPVAASV
jgi:pimeloyl-ACP methyl ester carboxylesterase